MSTTPRPALRLVRGPDDGPKGPAGESPSVGARLIEATQAAAEAMRQLVAAFEQAPRR